MTLKRYDLNTYRVWPWQEHQHGMFCLAQDVEQYVAAQRADAQREALEYIRGWTVYELAKPYHEFFGVAILEMQMHIDAALEQLAAGERMESVSQVDGGGA